MSEVIKKYRPPAIKKEDLERGCRYIDPIPQKDALGQDLKVGDIVCFAKGYEGSPDLIVGKIAGTYTRVNPPQDRVLRNNPNATHSVESGVSVYYITSNWQGQVKGTRYTIDSGSCIKILESQYDQSIKDNLLTA